MMAWKMSAVILVVLSCGMANIVARLESSFLTLAVHATASIEPAPHTYGVVAAAADDIKLQKDVEILRDTFLLSWIVGGCIPGACVGIWIRRIIKFVEIAKTFGVSLFTSFCVSPWVIKNYFNTAPETCLMVGFGIAVASWVGWEIALAIGGRLKGAAEKKGWIGVKEEILGGNIATVTTVPANPLPVPKVPPIDADKVIL